MDKNLLEELETMARDCAEKKLLLRDIFEEMEINCNRLREIIKEMEKPQVTLGLGNESIDDDSR